MGCLDRDKLPCHLAIIMDGNGRWAQQKHLSRIKGHQKGLESLRVVVETCAELGIKILTLYAFSKENWRRPKDEVNELMRLLRHYLVEAREELLGHDIRLNAIGDLDDLPLETRQLLLETMVFTQRHGGLVLNLALSYGGRSEIVAGVKAAIQDVQHGRITPDEITPENFSNYLFTPDLPDPDLLIRTSGEQRISNFMLWQLAYTELYFTRTLWPDFGRQELVRALEEYCSRERRFGRTSSQLVEGEAR